MSQYPLYFESCMPKCQLESIAYDFFFDPKTLVTLGGRSVEEAKGHMVILGNNVESFIKYAALVDGNTVDFLFGVRRVDRQASTLKHRANEVKEFLRTLEVHNHEVIASFYCRVFQSLINYHSMMSHWWSIFFSSWIYHQMLQEIQFAYKAMIKDLKVYQSDIANIF